MGSSTKDVCTEARGVDPIVVKRGREVADHADVSKKYFIVNNVFIIY